MTPVHVLLSHESPKVNELRLGGFLYPPYPPDLTPNDNGLFHASNNSFSQKICNGLDAVKIVVQDLTLILMHCLPSASRHALLAKDLVTWQAMVGRHILEDIVGRVAQYVDEHYPVDKWHLGDLIAWVAQSALKYRPRICELSKCLEGPLKMIVCPKKLLPTLSHLVKLLYAARQ
ncbi:hypothetical protein TNCV_959961 [Trichonephila clavipes]|nr:hypothetical protein TNCV_959961 [Trichonephila clavipes]